MTMFLKNPIDNRGFHFIYRIRKTCEETLSPGNTQKRQFGEILPWVHLTISSAKRMLLDIHHNIKPEFL
jgi:hypothetical protein